MPGTVLHDSLPRATKSLAATQRAESGGSIRELIRHHGGRARQKRTSDYESAARRAADLVGHSATPVVRNPAPFLARAPKKIGNFWFAAYVAGRMEDIRMSGGYGGKPVGATRTDK
jgi:hypothetical protein